MRFKISYTDNDAYYSNGSHITLSGLLGTDALAGSGQWIASYGNIIFNELTVYPGSKVIISNFSPTDGSTIEISANGQRILNGNGSYTFTTKQSIKLQMYIYSKENGCQCNYSIFF